MELRAQGPVPGELRTVLLGSLTPAARRCDLTRSTASDFFRRCPVPSVLPASRGHSWLQGPLAAAWAQPWASLCTRLALLTLVTLAPCSPVNHWQRQSSSTTGRAPAQKEVGQPLGAGHCAPLCSLHPTTQVLAGTGLQSWQGTAGEAVAQHNRAGAACRAVRFEWS